MDQKYAAFVGYASVIAFESLQILSAKHKIVPNIDMITDGARTGVRLALERFFPGLIRHPFSVNPLDDVILSLRYKFEDDPEQISAMFARQAKPSAPPLPPSWPQDETPKGYRVSASSRSDAGLSDTQQRKIFDTSALRRSGQVQIPAAFDQTPQPGAQNDPSSHRATVGSSVPPGADETQAPKTKLQRVGPAPVFPWEKLKNQRNNGE